MNGYTQAHPACLRDFDESRPQPKPLATRYRFLKRFGDVLLSVLAGLALSPVLLVASVLVGFTSRGPVVFRQLRVGRGGDLFTIYKFRTLHAHPHDARIAVDPLPATAVGGVLRRLSIDELPQLLNVVKGDMSLVGPRPVVPDETELLAARKRYGVDDIRPGLTGLAQVSGRDLLDAEHKAQLDGMYRACMSAPFDLWCMGKTVGVVLAGDGFDDEAHPFGDEENDEGGAR